MQTGAYLRSQLFSPLLFYVTLFFLLPKAYAKKSALKGGLDKTMALRKEMQEMQEWINQAEEDYLERDFTYKTPEELRKAVDELKVCRCRASREGLESEDRDLGCERLYTFVCAWR